MSPVILDAVLSEFKIKSGSLDYTSSIITSSIYGTASYGTGSYADYTWKFTGSLARVQDYLPQGIDNQKYAGSKLTSADFNIDSVQTVDGKPVVEWRTANPNQLIYQNNGQQGSFVLV